MYVCVSSLFLTIRQQHSGKIIKISLIAGSFGELHGAWYHASKFIFERLSDSFRMDLKQFGLEVVVIN